MSSMVGDPDHGLTMNTTISYLERGYEVRAMGGYDGYLTREFSTIEEALEFVAGLWHVELKPSAEAPVETP